MQTVSTRAESINNERARRADPPSGGLSRLTTLLSDGRKVLLASPRGYCAGVERAVETVERALELYERAGLRPQADRPQRPRRARPRGARSGLRRGRGGRTRGPDDGALRPRRRAVGARERAGARAPHDRRHLPARHQGARPGAPVRSRRLHRRPDRACRPRGGRRDDGRDPRTRSSLVESREQVAELEFPPGTKLAYVTQTTLSVDETREVIAALRERFPEIRAPQREDICYATSNRQWAVKELLPEIDLLLVIGSQQLVELEPARRDRARRRSRLLPDRRRDRDRRGLVR